MYATLAIGGHGSDGKPSMRYARKVLLPVRLVNKTQVAAFRSNYCFVRCYLAHTREGSILEIPQQTVATRKRLVRATDKHVALTRFRRDTLNRTSIFERPNFDMSCADRDELVAHPCHAIDVAHAFVAGV